MDEIKSEQKKSFYHNLPNFLKLYVFYLAITIFTWGINKLFFKEKVASVIYESTESLEPIVVYTESCFLIFLKTFLILAFIYFILFFVSKMLNAKISKGLYLVMVLMVALASGTWLGGGLLTYTWGHNIFASLIGQMEWIGGAMILSYGKNEESVKTLVLGVILIMLSALISALAIA